MCHYLQDDVQEGAQVLSAEGVVEEVDALEEVAYLSYDTQQEINYI